MRSFALILALVLVGCVSTEGMTDEERREVYLARLARAETAIAVAVPIAQAYVDEGRWKQGDVDLAFAAADAAVAGFRLAIENEDRVAADAAYTDLLVALARVGVLAATRDPEPHRPGA